MGGVDVDERLLAGAGQQRGMRGQRAQEPPVHRMELEGVPVGERAEEGAQSGRSTDPAEHGRQRTVPQDVKVVDAVRPRDHPGHDTRDLGVRRRTRAVLRSRQLDLLGHQP
jgi:hypothetical protein